MSAQMSFMPMLKFLSRTKHAWASIILLVMKKHYQLLAVTYCEHLCACQFYCLFLHICVVGVDLNANWTNKCHLIFTDWGISVDTNLY